MKKVEFILIKELLNIKIIEKYISLSKSEYSENNPVSKKEHLIWKYLNNPVGISYGINGYCGDKLVARISYQNKNFIFKNKIIKGANLCDLLIHKKNRKLENFLKLIKPFFIDKDVPGSNLSIMLPNEISINIYKKILNIKPIGTLELRVIPILNSLIRKKLKIRIPKFISSFSCFLSLFLLRKFQNISKLNFSTNDVRNEDYEIMIRNYYGDNLIQGKRDKNWIQWRYSSKSTINYLFEYIFLDNQLIGYFACRKSEKNGLKILVIMEIVIIKNNFLIELTIFFKLLSIAKKLKCDLILSLRSIQNSNPLSSLLFPKIPNFLLPIPLEFFIVTNEESSPHMFDIKNWKINMADFDIF